MWKHCVSVRFLRSDRGLISVLGCDVSLAWGHNILEEYGTSIFRAILELYWWQKTTVLTLYSLLVLAESFGRVGLFWDISLKFQILYYCGLHNSDDTLLWDKSLEYYLIVRYKSQILLPYCEILISSIVSSAWDINLKYIVLSDSNLRCFLIVSYKSQILLADCEIRISNIASLWWDTNVKHYLLIVRWISQMLL
jgi:hypothetical protein